MILLFNLFKLGLYLKDKKDISVLLHYLCMTLHVSTFRLYFQKSFVKLSIFPTFFPKETSRPRTSPHPNVRLTFLVEQIDMCGFPNQSVIKDIDDSQAVVTAE